MPWIIAAVFWAIVDSFLRLDYVRRETDMLRHWEQQRSGYYTLCRESGIPNPAREVDRVFGQYSPGYSVWEYTPPQLYKLDIERMRSRNLQRRQAKYRNFRLQRPQ